jgi:hypothetical protein
MMVEKGLERVCCAVYYREEVSWERRKREM